jgi:stage II sporulation protein AA (anti-sigma F factor antagonist)
MKFSMVADDGRIVSLRCDGDMSNVDFRGDEPLEQLIGKDGLKRHVILNLEKVRFLDSSGISWLLIRHKHFKENGGRLVLHSLPPLVRQPLEFMKLSRVLHIAGDEDAARSVANDG